MTPVELLTIMIIDGESIPVGTVIDMDVDTALAYHASGAVRILAGLEGDE